MRESRESRFRYGDRVRVVQLSRKTRYTKGSDYTILKPRAIDWRGWRGTIQGFLPNGKPVVRFAIGQCEYCGHVQWKSADFDDEELELVRGVEGRNGDG